jgi:hypothetical protein
VHTIAALHHGGEHHGHAHPVGLAVVEIFASVLFPFRATRQIAGILLLRVFVIAGNDHGGERNRAGEPASLCCHCQLRCCLGTFSYAGAAGAGVNTTIEETEIISMENVF